MVLIKALEDLRGSGRVSEAFLSAIMRGMVLRTRTGKRFLFAYLAAWGATWVVVLALMLPVFIYVMYLPKVDFSLKSVVAFLTVATLYGKLAVPRMLDREYFRDLCLYRIKAKMRFQNLYRPSDRMGDLGYPSLRRFSEALARDSTIRLYLRNFGLRERIESTSLVGGGFRLGSGYHSINIEGRKLEEEILSKGQEQYLTVSISDVNDPTPPDAAVPFFATDEDWPVLVREFLALSDSIVVLALELREGLMQELDFIDEASKISATTVYAVPAVKRKIEETRILENVELIEIEDPEERRIRVIREARSVLDDPDIPVFDSRRFDALLRLGEITPKKQDIELDFFEKLILPIIMAVLLIPWLTN